MSDQLSEVDILFRKRTDLIGNISQKNAEHLRILQLSSGIEILLMKDPDSLQVNQDKSDTDAKITNSLNSISELEAELAKIDSEIDVALKKEA